MENAGVSLLISTSRYVMQLDHASEIGSGNDERRPRRSRWSLAATATMAAIFSFAAGPAFAHDRTDILEAKTVHEGSWGSWSEWAFCPGPGNNAVGIDVKKEGGDGPFSDDVGVTGITNIPAIYRTYQAAYLTVAGVK